MSESTFKTGDPIICSDHHPVVTASTRMIYLCTVGVGKHLCVNPTEWEEEDFENVCEYQYIDKPRVYYIVKQANEIVKWLEEHGYKQPHRVVGYQNIQRCWYSAEQCLLNVVKI